jgi:eukaryotic-like serine/threonine-protein kinase
MMRTNRQDGGRPFESGAPGVKDTVLGHYRILELLGKGGMGEVYVGEDTRLGRRVAVKILSRELGLSPDQRERFEREARAVAALNHPNIVTIHSVEEADGVPFLTLELLEGRTLDSAIPQDGMPVDRLLACAIPLADAVGAAHQRGITHRDLKPANVMLTTDGRIKVLDFGLAKLKEDASAASAALPTQELTGEGRIVGTVAYMSPEQAEAKPVDTRSDVFSLGVMLFEMATGQRPFKGDTQVSLLSSILKDTPSSITDVKATLPRDLARIVKRCLNKDPEDRYQTAKDLRNDLRLLKDDLASGEAAAIQPGMHAGAPRATKAPPSRTPIVAGALVVLALIAAGVYWRTRLPAGSNTAFASVPFGSVGLTRLTTTGTTGLAVISDDGRYVAYVVTEEGKSGVWLRQVATSSNVQIVPPAEVRFLGLSFSADGNHVYYAIAPVGEVFASLYQVPVLGGGVRRVMDDVDGTVTFEPGGKRLAFGRRVPKLRQTTLVVVDVNGTNEKTIASRQAPNSFNLQSVAWSPDGRVIAIPAVRSETLQTDVVLVDVESGKEMTVGRHPWRDVTHVAWLPDGRSLLINAQDAEGESTNQIWLISVPGGDVRRITNDLSTYTGLSVTADGKTILSVRNELRARIWTTDGLGGGAREPTSGPAADDGVRGIAWTPDARLVYASASAGNSDIWIMNADGRNRVQLTFDRAHDTLPDVTPDGRRIVFVSERGGVRGLWVMGIDGGEQHRLGTAPIGARPTLSPDGKWVYYTETGAAGKNFRISIDGGDAVPIVVPDSADTRIVPESFHEPIVSPDGKMIAGHYRDQEQRGERIAVVYVNGSPAKLFPTVRIPVRWSADGKSLLYLMQRGGASNLWRQPIDGGPTVQVTRFADATMFEGAGSTSLNRWAIVRGDTSRDVVLISSR